MSDTDKPIRPNFTWYMERIGDPDAPFRPSPYEDTRDLRDPQKLGMFILGRREYACSSENHPEDCGLSRVALSCIRDTEVQGLA